MPEFSPEVRTKPVQGPAPSTVPALPHLAPATGWGTRPIRRAWSLVVSIGMLAVTVVLGGTAATVLLREHDGEPSTPTVLSAAATMTDADGGGA